MIKLQCKSMQLYYNNKKVKLIGQPSLSMIANLMEAANKAEHQNRYLNMTTSHCSLKYRGGMYELNWYDIESYGLGDEIKEESEV